MKNFSITYRKMNGSTGYATVTASSESEARAIFFRNYDGRIIDIS